MRSLFISVAPPGQNLVRVRLMPDVPDQPVVGRIEYIVKRNRELDRAEIRGEVASSLGHRFNQESPQLACKLLQCLAVKFAERRWIIDQFE